MERCRDRVPALLGLLVAAVVALTACGGTPSSHRSSPAPTPRTAATSAPSATPVPGYETDQQAADAGARQSGQSICPDQYPGHPALTTPEVSVYSYATAGACGVPSPHAVFLEYVYRDSGGWHAYGWGASQSTILPNGTWGAVLATHPGGCFNVRQAPSRSARVVRCVKGDATTGVLTDTVLFAGTDHSPWYAPVWADQNLWWYVFEPTAPLGAGPPQGRPLGWMALGPVLCTWDSQVC